MDINTRIELEALITEREGMVAENQGNSAFGQIPAQAHTVWCGCGLELGVHMETDNGKIFLATEFREIHLNYFQQCFIATGPILAGNLARTITVGKNLEGN